MKRHLLKKSLMLLLSALLMAGVVAGGMFSALPTAEAAEPAVITVGVGRWATDLDPAAASRVQLAFNGSTWTGGTSVGAVYQGKGEDETGAPVDVEVVWDATGLLLKFDETVNPVILRKSTLFSLTNALPGAPESVCFVQDYMISYTVDTSRIYADSVQPLNCTLIPGNARWATTLEGGNFRYSISYDLAVVTGEWNTSQAYYTGKVWNAGETEAYDVELYLSSTSVVVDTTSVKLTVYLPGGVTEFRMLAEETFSLKSGYAGPKTLRFDRDYLVSFTPDTSEIETTPTEEQTGESGADETPPVLDYEGKTSYVRKAGDCQIIFLVSATDETDGDVLVERIWPENAVDENCKLLAGEYTVILRATDRAGNSAQIPVTVVVTA